MPSSRRAVQLPTPSKLTNEQLAQILPKLPMLKAFVKAVETEAMLMLAHDPTSIKGYKIVEGQSRRRWTDQARTIKALLKAGFRADDFAPRELAGMGEVAKLLPAPKRAAFMDAHTFKPRGKPSLASADDPRAPINGKAALDFADDITDTED